MKQSLLSSSSSSSLDAQSIVLNTLIDDPQMQEMIVLEYERLTPKQIYRNLRVKSHKQGYCLIHNWFCLLLSNFLLVALFALISSAIMLASKPPGTEKTVTAAPLKTNQFYNTSCFTFDSSCDVKRNLWCVDSRCQCIDQMTYWNGTSCIYCPTTFYYNGSSCVCPYKFYLYQQASTNSCRAYQNYSQTCSVSLLCNPSSSIGLVCTAGICRCASGYYWNLTNANSTGACVPYSSNTQTCSNTTQCMPTTSLICVNQTCQCPTSGGKYVWNGLKCVQIASYNGSCVVDNECDGTLILTCQSSLCVCAGTTPQGTWFWNGTMCILCPTGWMNFQTHCYFLSSMTTTWNISRDYCQQAGGDLMVINDNVEYAFITNVAQTLMPTTNWVAAWVGSMTLSKTGQGTFQWIDSSLPTYTISSSFWCRSPYWYEPDYVVYSGGPYNGVYQQCECLVHFNYGNHVCLDDQFCFLPMQFICEKSQ